MLTSILHTRNLQKKLNVALAALLVATQLAVPLTMFGTAEATNHETITATDHQGQLKPSGTYANGPITTYVEQDWINFRFKLTANDVASGAMQIEFSTTQPECTFFSAIQLGTHDNSAADVVSVSGATPTVSLGIPTNAGTEFHYPIIVNFSAAGEAIVNYSLRVGSTAGNCTTTTTHTELGNSSAPGDFANVEPQTIFVPADQLLHSALFIVSKHVHEDDDDQPDRVATAGEWDFTLSGPSGTETKPTPAVGSIIFNVGENGTYTLTESDVSGYSFLFGTTSQQGPAGCSFDDQGVVTFEVTLDTEDHIISCGFHNKVVSNGPATVTLIKEVINDDGGTAMPTDFIFDMSGAHVLTSGGSAQFDAGLSPSVSERPFPGYEFVEITGDDECPTNLPGEFDSLEAGANITCTIVNDDIPGHITVDKQVINDDGGTITDADDFFFFVNGARVEDEQRIAFPANQNYVITENAAPGYMMESLSCADDDGELTLNPGFTLKLAQEVICIIINNDIPEEPELASITLIKEVINDDGGTAEPGDFPLFLNDSELRSGDTQTWDAGDTPQIGEQHGPAYQFVEITGDPECPATLLTPFAPLAAGANITCTIVNDDRRPPTGSVVIFKSVRNDDGGTATREDFDLYLNDIQVESGEYVDLAPGQYVISEIMNVPGYELSSLSCQQYNDEVGDEFELINGNTFVLEAEFEVECEMVNDDLPRKPRGGIIVVEKKVINDDGGTATVEDFDLFVTCQTPGPFTDATRLGSPATQALDTVLGADVPSDTMDVYCTETQVESGTPDLYMPGWYSVREEMKVRGYEHTQTHCSYMNNGEEMEYGEGMLKIQAPRKGGIIEGDDQPGYFFLYPGAYVHCEIVNDDIPQPKKAHVTVAKHIINDNGGTATTSDFDYFINGAQVPLGVARPVYAGQEVTISEHYRVPGYRADSIRCYDQKTDHELGHPFTARPDQRIVCVIVNNDQPATVIVQKHTLDSESDQPFDFTVTDAHGNNHYTTLDTSSQTSSPHHYDVFSGLPAGNVTITEKEVAGWDSALFIDCAPGYIADNGEVVMSKDLTVWTHDTNVANVHVGLGETVVCSFLNSKQGSIVVTKFNDENNNRYFDEGEAVLSDWDMKLTPLAGTEHGLFGPSGVKTQTTGTDGTTTFHVTTEPYMFYALDEVQQDGWTQTALYCEDEGGHYDYNGYNLGVSADETVYCFIGNSKDPEVLGGQGGGGLPPAEKVVQKAAEALVETGSSLTILFGPSGIATILAAVWVTRLRAE